MKKVIIVLAVPFFILLASAFITDSVGYSDAPTLDVGCQCVWNNQAYTEWQDRCYRQYMYECRCRSGNCGQWEYVGGC